MVKKASEKTVDFSSSLGKPQKKEEKVTLISEYSIKCRDLPLDIRIYKKKGEYVPLYDISIPAIGRHTMLILEKIRQQLIKSVNLGVIQIDNFRDQQEEINDEFKETVTQLVRKYFPTIEKEYIPFFVSFVLLRSIGLGEVEILMSDPKLEEIAINGAGQHVWVYHRQHNWLRTNIIIDSEEQIKYFSSTIGRRVGRQISVLEPLLDVVINVGDRVNATLMPISNEGNTITIRKFSAKPWTIYDFLTAKTISAEAAAHIWHAMQYELSCLIAGGTASGKTSMLNILSTFIPPNQRIVSIEDTREIKLPSYLHVVPMLTRLKNAEGRGEVSMLKLLQNSLRMRPDRILVGEIRRPAEAEVLFEAIHTGHSVYATIHANTAEETVTRLTNPPINVPKILIPALSLIIVQYRNRRSGKRRTFQIAEVTEKGDANVLFQYNATKDKLETANTSKSFYKTLQTFTGDSLKKIKEQIKEKEKVLNYIVKKKITEMDDISQLMAEYYEDPKAMMKKIQ